MKEWRNRRKGVKKQRRLAEEETERKGREHKHCIEERESEERDGHVKTLHARERTHENTTGERGHVKTQQTRKETHEKY